MNVIYKIGKSNEFIPVNKINDNTYEINFEKTLINNDEENESENVYQWKSFIYSPLKDGNIITVINNIINSQTERNIIYGFVWNNYNINLSKENQMNYKAAFDLAVNTNGESLPYTIKVYKFSKKEFYTFDSLDEIKDFYLKMNKYINDCLMEGWQRKDNVNASDYKI